MALSAGVLLAAMPAARARQPRGDVTPEQRQAIVGVLRDALRDDPSILRDAVTALQASERRQREGAAQAAIRAHRDALVRDSADPVKGNPAGAVTVVEFFDPRCGYCKQLAPTLDEVLRQHPDVRLVLKDMPVLGPASVLASRALLAAERQGKYVALHDALMRLRGEPTEPVLRHEAAAVGIDWARLQHDMDDPAVARRIQDNLQLAQALQIQGTPALVIGDRLIPGAADRAKLEGAIAATRTTTARGGVVALGGR
ncbi:membrane protein [Gemmatimonadetes bacterium T265]|nr:membrane protein [Gemmatimonadetes bacterium T265]